MLHKFFFTADRRPTVCFLAWICLGSQLPGINPPISPALVIKGGPVTVNDDDANANEEWDKDDTGPVENTAPRLRQFTLTAVGVPGGGTVNIDTGGLSPHARLWRNENKENLLDASHPVSPAGKEILFWVEGLEPTAKTDSLELKARYVANRGNKHADASLRFGVYQVDMDVDSNNDDGLSVRGYTDAEDKIEASPRRRGKVLLGTNGDIDNDGIPDFVDGCGIVGGDGQQVDGLKLVPVRLELKKPINPSTAKVKFTYDASIPRLGEGVGEVTSPDGTKSYRIMHPGLRLWRVDGDKRRSGRDMDEYHGGGQFRAGKRGDFIPANKAIAWKDLVPNRIWKGEFTHSQARSTILYVEAVGFLSGDPSPVTVEVMEADAPGDVIDTIRFSLPAVEFVTPAGDPVNHPRNSGDGQNEFSFNPSSPGILEIGLKAKVPGMGVLGADILSKFAFEIDEIGSSHMQWNPANPDGKPTFHGDFMTARVKFTGLPDQNADFGTKMARVRFDGDVAAKEDFEVFFPRDATNHPGGKMDVWDRATLRIVPGDVPNWFFYWGQLPEAHGLNLAYGGARGAIGGAVPAIVHWSYDTPIDKTLIVVYDGAVAASRSYGVGEFMSGIDRFLGAVVIHEAKHLDQILRADALLPTTGGDSFRYGWSWNVAIHNHWRPGPDGGWGVAGRDDDLDGIVDNARTAPVFEVGGGDDESLDHPLWTWWPGTWPLPVPNLTRHPIESEAVNASDVNYNENKNARKDWANLGKNHKTLDKWDD